MKRILQEVDRNRVNSQVAAMQQALMVAKISQLLVGAIRFSAPTSTTSISWGSTWCVFSRAGKRPKQMGYFRPVQS